MQQVSYSRTIKVKATPEETLPLFTASGERLWIKEWNPTYIYPESGEAKPGMIWKTTTDANVDEIWVTVIYNVKQHTAAYVKWSPEKNVTQIDIQCSSIEDNLTLVKVTYTVTALSEEGLVSLKSFTKENYDSFINKWEKAIDRYLQDGEATHFH